MTALIGAFGGYARKDADEEGFLFRDDAFRRTAQSGFADGVRLSGGGFNGGGLSVTLGGSGESNVVALVNAINYNYMK